MSRVVVFVTETKKEAEKALKTFLGEPEEDHHVHLSGYHERYSYRPYSVEGSGCQIEESDVGNGKVYVLAARVG